MNLSFIISKAEVLRLLKIAKDRFRSKKRVNKLMLGKIDEVTKETKTILRQFVIERRYDVNLAHYVTHPKEQSRIHPFQKCMQPFLIRKNINFMRKPFRQDNQMNKPQLQMILIMLMLIPPMKLYMIL